MVQLSQAEDSQIALDPRARLIIAAAEFMNDDYTTAAGGLFHLALAGEWEADLWRAALAAVSQDWSLAAAGFAATDVLIDAYPHVVRARLRLLAAESSLANGDRDGAERYLEAVRLDNPSHTQEAQVAYLVARGLYLEGDTETAAELWRRVAASKHASSRIRARLALLDLALEDGSLSTDKAIEKLERLRFAWRGDRFEFALLQRKVSIARVYACCVARPRTRPTRSSRRWWRRACAPCSPSCSASRIASFRRSRRSPCSKSSRS